MSICEAEHRYHPMFDDLPDDQGGSGRHHCAGCAYNRGYKQGLEREEVINMSLDTLKVSQAGTVRHKSAHAAFALGYLHGVEKSYETNQ